MVDSKSTALVRTILVSSILVALSACGGGGGSDTAEQVRNDLRGNTDARCCGVAVKPVPPASAPS